MLYHGDAGPFARFTPPHLTAPAGAVVQQRTQKEKFYHIHVHNFYSAHHEFPPSA